MLDNQKIIHQPIPDITTFNFAPFALQHHVFIHQ